MGHRHYAAGTDAHGHLDASAPFQYGYAYRHILFTLDARSLRMRRFSREFCLPALAVGDCSRPGDRPDSGGALDAPLPQQLCEGVQFIMSAFRHPAQNNASGTRSRIARLACHPRRSASATVSTTARRGCSQGACCILTRSSSSTHHECTNATSSSLRARGALPKALLATTSALLIHVSHASARTFAAQWLRYLNDPHRKMTN